METLNRSVPFIKDLKKTYTLRQLVVLYRRIGKILHNTGRPHYYIYDERGDKLE